LFFVGQYTISFTYTDNRTTIIYLDNHICQLIFDIFQDVKQKNQIIIFLMIRSKLNEDIIWVKKINIDLKPIQNKSIR